MRDYDKWLPALLVFGLIAAGAFWLTVAYIVLHFIQKFW